MTTVYDEPGVVNPVPAQLGTGVLDLYDWLRLRHRPGRMRRVGELTPPGAPRYEQLAERLRRRIFDGTWPDEASGPFFGREYNVSQPVVQRAFEALEREGLVRTESGRRTAVVPRSRWRVDAGALLPAGATRELALAEAARVDAAIRAAGQPAFSGASAQRVGSRVLVIVTVESADLPGAVAAALPAIRQALAPMEIERQAAEPA
jgi:DNA-binding transcriptional regulator YhcF (GntR family)